MTTGFGVDPVLDANNLPIAGTSSQDVRNVWAGLYTPGIVNGGVVNRSATKMEYNITAGVAAIPTATGEIVMAPIPAGTITTDPAPSVGSRTDIVYVQQEFPSIEGSNDVIIDVGPTLPLRSVLLGSYTIGTGIANTNAAVPAGPVDFSIPIGGSMGRLHSWGMKFDGLLYNHLVRYGHGTFYIPTDRILTFKVRAVISAHLAQGFDDSKYVEVGFLFNIDGGDIVLHTTPGLHQSWATYEFQTTTTVGAGVHNVNLGITRNSGPGTAYTHYGLGGDGYGRTGIEFEVWDEGVLK